MDMILDSLKKDFSYKEVTEGTYNDSGDYVPGIKNTIDFKGAMLPLIEKDMEFLPEGVYGISDQKLYASVELKDNTKIKDDITEEEYTVYAFRSYNIINPDFKRYFIKKVKKING
ncbi:TPA: hypothetical protein PTV97_003747 [Clostridium botulinum]|nr:hypothetical protein [Clostridium botulinum]